MPAKQKNYTGYFENARVASRKIIDPSKINFILKQVAKTAIADIDYLLQENQKDLDRMDVGDPK